MKYCTNCGVQLPDEAKFCKECGTKLQAATSARTSDDGKGIEIDAPEGATIEIEDEEEKKGVLSRIVGYIILYAKVIAIAVGVVFVAVMVKEYFLEQNDKERILPQDETNSAQEEGFEDVDDMTLEERVVFMENLLQRTEKELQEEEAKGAEADQDYVKQLRKDIQTLRESLREMQ